MPSQEAAPARRAEQPNASHTLPRPCTLSLAPAPSPSPLYPLASSLYPLASPLYPLPHPLGTRSGPLVLTPCATCSRLQSRALCAAPQPATTLLNIEASRAHFEALINNMSNFGAAPGPITSSIGNIQGGAESQPPPLAGSA